MDPIEVADARMEYDLECSGYNVRQFLGTFSAQGTLGEIGSTVMSDILAVVDDIEQQTDAVLDGDNEEGWELFQTKVAVSTSNLVQSGPGFNRESVACCSPLPHHLNEGRLACQVAASSHTLMTPVLIVTSNFSHQL